MSMKPTLDEMIEAYQTDGSYRVDLIVRSLKALGFIIAQIRKYGWDKVKGKPEIQKASELVVLMRGEVALKYTVLTEEVMRHKLQPPS